MKTYGEERDAAAIKAANGLGNKDWDLYVEAYRRGWYTGADRAHQRSEKEIEDLKYQLTCYRLDGPAHTLADDCDKLRAELKNEKQAAIKIGENMDAAINESFVLRARCDRLEKALIELSDTAAYDDDARRRPWKIASEALKDKK